MKLRNFPEKRIHVSCLRTYFTCLLCTHFSTNDIQREVCLLGVISLIPIVFFSMWWSSLRIMAKKEKSARLTPFAGRLNLLDPITRITVRSQEFLPGLSNNQSCSQQSEFWIINLEVGSRNHYFNSARFDLIGSFIGTLRNEGLALKNVRQRQKMVQEIGTEKQKKVSILFFSSRRNFSLLQTDKWQRIFVFIF